MKNVTVSRTAAALGTLAAIAWAGQAQAIEPGSSDPHLPGISDGVPAGALPPPGFYFVNTTAYTDGSLNDGNGNPTTAAHVDATAWIEIPGLTWVSPFHIFGAQYGAAIAQPVVTEAATTNGATVNRTGLFNLVLVPAILSWHLPAGFFASVSFVVYPDEGDTGAHSNAAGTVNGTDTVEHIANNTTTFAPSAAISWFNGHGLETSLNMEYDIQTADGDFLNTPAIPALGIPAITEKYQSGDLLNLDFTVQQVLPGPYRKWTVGAVGYYSVQTNDDQVTASANGVSVTQTVAAVPGLNGTGNRFEKFGLGPTVGYNFGPVAFQTYYTQDLYAKNTTQNGTFFVRLAIPL
jgi:hypothetical protein